MVGDIPLEEVCPAQKLAYLFYVRRRGPVGQDIDLTRVRTDAVSRDDVAEEFERGGEEVTFAALEEPGLVAEAIEDQVEVNRVLLDALAEDNYVVKVHCAALPDQAMQKLVHPALKSGGCISKTEWDYLPLELTQGA